MKFALKALAHYAESVRANGLRGTLENAAALMDDLRFDRIHGTETAQDVSLDALAVRGRNKHLGIGYTPTRVRAFHKLMAHLKPPLGGVFVDFGCGKGRILCAAAAYPFRRIVGIEFAPELAAICRTNVTVYSRSANPSADIVIIEGDAAEYRFTGDEEVIFLFNPFRPAVMAVVLGNLHRSLRVRHRVVQLIVSNPAGLAPVLAKDALLRKTDEYAYGSSRFFIYSNAPS
ncbi:class I SAM-dependent methyltransferase [Azospirillum sp. TSO22-1]|uniref:class I SAM-dependent methyltransferase n=1 Tax=Azospirillum sp. TSO22-1 TaxID=716789 RepID=UPI00130501E2|nr:class I SAM-dependent methyltransferase [Azospirillum sp. TSO22-1]